jgi:hypothetical protein
MISSRWSRHCLTAQRPVQAFDPGAEVDIGAGLLAREMAR